MPKKSPLDEKLLIKIAEKRSKDILSTRKAVSARASKFHISPQAALVGMAHESGVKTAVYERSLDADTREQIRSFNLPRVMPNNLPKTSRPVHAGTGSFSKKLEKRPWWENPWLLAVGSVVLGGLILAYVFGVGG